MLWIFPFNNLAFYYRNKYDLALNVQDTTFLLFQTNKTVSMSFWDASLFFLVACRCAHGCVCMKMPVYMLTFSVSVNGFHFCVFVYCTECFFCY